MSFPIVPSRSRISGEVTFVRYFPLIEADAHLSDIVYYSDGTNLIVKSSTKPLDIGVWFILNESDFPSDIHVFEIIEIVNGSEYRTNIEYSDTSEKQVQLSLISDEDFYVTGQIINIEASETPTTFEIKALGQVQKFDKDQPNLTIRITLYNDKYLDSARLLGNDPSKTFIDIDHELPYHVHLLVQSYSSNVPSEAQLLHSAFYEFVQWTEFVVLNNAGKNSYQQWQLSGKARHKTFIK